MTSHLVRRRTALAALAATATLPAGIATAAETGGHGRGRRPGWVSSTLARMTLEQKVGQLFIQHVYGADATTPDERNIELYGVAAPAEVVQKFQLGGVIYFAWTDNVEDPEQIAGLSNGLQRAAMRPPRDRDDDKAGKGRDKKKRKVQIPLSISTDQEQGVVTRIGPPATQFPGAMALGAGRSERDARAAAAITALELRAMGINTNFAPIADVNVNPANPVIGTRSFSSSPELAAQMVAAQVIGLERDGNVAASAKHFPGHGDTDTDSHEAFPIITHSREEWERLDAPPFKAAIRAGIDMIMTAHLNFPALDPSGDPATLSKPVITGMLREELGYEGVVVTDSLRMEGVREKYGDAEVAVRALEAGVDHLLMTPAMEDAHAAVMEAVASGRITERELDAKVRRILELKCRRDIHEDYYVDTHRLNTRVGTRRRLAKAAQITERGITLVRNDEQILPLHTRGASILVAGPKEATNQTIADTLTDTGATVAVEVTGAAPTAAQIASAVAAARGKDAVVVTTNRAWDTPEQQALVKALHEGEAPVIVVAVRDPYDIAHLPGTKAYLATYSESVVSLESVARIIAGKARPGGELPVSIPRADDPQAEAYPFGHGLSY